MVWRESSIARSGRAEADKHIEQNGPAGYDEVGRPASRQLMCLTLADTDADLPQMSPAIPAYHAAAASLDWSDRDAVLDYQVGAWRLLSGSAHEFDEAQIRCLAAADYDRTPNPLTAFNHALISGGERWYGRLAEIEQPTLIVHGTEDPVPPYAHALALERGIPNTTLLTLAGSGHEPDPADWPVIIDAISAHTESNSAAQTPDIPGQQGVRADSQKRNARPRREHSQLTAQTLVGRQGSRCSRLSTPSAPPRRAI
ncbi:MAG: alpha/beta hydrolase [Actinobacteria bacterium]|nr:alpha/beta hydrolase [Actinomycetota bacterium]